MYLSDNNQIFYNLPHRDSLLSDIAKGLEKLSKTKTSIANIKVIFSYHRKSDRENNEFEFSLAGALDTIANDLYFDERGDWSNANTARVETY